MVKDRTAGSGPVFGGMGNGGSIASQIWMSARGGTDSVVLTLVEAYKLTTELGTMSPTSPPSPLRLPPAIIPSLRCVDLIYGVYVFVETL